MERNIFREFIENLRQLDEIKPESRSQTVRESTQIAANIMANFNVPESQETLEMFAYVIDRINRIGGEIIEETGEKNFNYLLLWTARGQPNPMKAVYYAFLLGVIFQELFGEDEPPF